MGLCDKTLGTDTVSGMIWATQRVRYDWTPWSDSGGFADRIVD